MSVSGPCFQARRKTEAAATLRRASDLAYSVTGSSVGGEGTEEGAEDAKRQLLGPKLQQEVRHLAVLQSEILHNYTPCV